MGVLGCKRGVVRGVGAAGFVYVNGHRPIPQRLAAQILALLDRVGRPMTAREVAAELGYSSKHVRECLTNMGRDGCLVVTPGWGNVAANYGLTKWATLAELEGEDQKRCAKCERVLPLSDFQRDSSQPKGRHSRCRWCRSKKADKAAVKFYPSRVGV